MKKGILILLGMFMMVSTIEAKNGENLPNRIGVNYYAYNNAVNFFENGIEFFVFTNGDFDFDINLANRRIPIDRDFRGRINRIGNVSLRYDFRGNITRIGTISIRYFRDRLTRVGDLRVGYDRWGYPIFNGKVRDFYTYNGIRFNLNFGNICDYNDAYFSHRDFRRNYSQIREDHNFYYYRANTNANIGNRSQILRRRKPTVINANRRTTVDTNRNNSYRKLNTVNARRTKSERRSTNSTFTKPIADTSKRKPIAEKRNTTKTNRKPVKTERKVENTTKRTFGNRDRSERKSRN